MMTMIMPISDLRKQTGEVIRRIRETGDVVYITQHGRPSVVLLDFEQYEAMQARLLLQQSVSRVDAAALLQSWIDEGDVVEQTETSAEVFAALNETQTSGRELFPATTEGVDW